LKLLRQSKWNDFFGGIITNARLPWFVPRRLRQLKPLNELEHEHPIFPEDYAAGLLSKYYPKLRPCIENGFRTALDAAKTELAIEEIALSQAILGLYQDALFTSQRLTETDRANNVRFVIAIEQFRRGQVDEAAGTQTTLLNDTLTGWGGAQFALGICNRVPWCPYPYPDY
jgi:hypothetical protein